MGLKEDVCAATRRQECEKMHIRVALYSNSPVVSPASHATVIIFSLSFFLSFFFRSLSQPDLGSQTNTLSPFKDRVTHPIRPPLIRVNYVLFNITGLERRDAKGNCSCENESETVILKEKRGKREGRKE